MPPHGWIDHVRALAAVGVIAGAGITSTPDWERQLPRLARESELLGSVATVTLTNAFGREISSLCLRGDLGIAAGTASRGAARCGLRARGRPAPPRGHRGRGKCGETPGGRPHPNLRHGPPPRHRPHIVRVEGLPNTETAPAKDSHRRTRTGRRTLKARPVTLENASPLPRHLRAE